MRHRSLIFITATFTIQKPSVDIVIAHLKPLVVKRALEAGNEEIAFPDAIDIGFSILWSGGPVGSEGAAIC